MREVAKAEVNDTADNKVLQVEHAAVHQNLQRKLCEVFNLPGILFFIYTLLYHFDNKETNQWHYLHQYTEVHIEREVVSTQVIRIQLRSRCTCIFILAEREVEACSEAEIADCILRQEEVGRNPEKGQSSPLKREHDLES